MLVVVAVPEREMGYLRVGDTHEVRVDALGGEKATGTIGYISETADGVIDMRDVAAFAEGWLTTPQ